MGQFWLFFDKKFVLRLIEEITDKQFVIELFVDKIAESFGKLGKSIISIGCG